MIRHRSILFSLGVIAFLCTLPASKMLRMDRSLENMFSQDNPIRTRFERLQSTFGVSELVVVAYRDPQLWKSDGSGIEKLHAIRKQIESIPGIDSAMDLSKLNQMLVQWQSATSLFGSEERSQSAYPLLSNQDSLALRMKKLFEGQTHSAHSDLVAIACILKRPDVSPVPTSQTLRDLRNVDVGPGQSILLAGQRVMIEEGFDAIEEDGRRLGLASALSLIVLLLLGFRSLRWALIHVALIEWSITVSRGLMVALSWQITMVSSMMASLVTVISVATLMHWMLGFQQELARGAAAEDALSRSFKTLRSPIAWACVTDAIAFASLSLSNVGPVQDYGCMMALSSMVVLLGIVLLVPTLALSSILPRGWEEKLAMSIELAKHRKDVTQAASQDRVSRWLVLALDRFAPQARSIVIVSSVIGFIATWGATQIVVETNFIKNFKQSSSLVKAYTAIETELGGAGVWDVLVPVPSTIRTDDVDRVRLLEDKIRALTFPSGAKAISSVTSAVDADDVWRENRLLSRLSFDMRFNGVRAILGSFAESLIANDDTVRPTQRMLRIMLRSQEQLAAIEKQWLIDQVSVLAEQTYSDSTEKPFVSGYYILLTSLVSSVVADQWVCLGIASLGVWIASAIALRSVLLPTLALMPNLLPSMLIMGWFGWTGTPINLGAAMIAAVSLGISVDSSLHYLTRFRREKERGCTTRDALAASQSEIGLAVLLATIAMVVGFGSLSLSEFLPTVVFGTTAALSMLGGLVGNLVLLPALVLQFLPDKEMENSDAAT